MIVVKGKSLDYHESDPPAVMSISNETYHNVIGARAEAYEKAIDSLGRYKFEMFGYHASAWVKYNKLLPRLCRNPNPFKAFVDLAKTGSRHEPPTEV